MNPSKVPPKKNDGAKSHRKTNNATLLAKKKTKRIKRTSRQRSRHSPASDDESREKRGIFAEENETISAIPNF